MNKKFLIAVLVGLFGAGVARANDSNGDWIMVAEGSESLWYAKKASGHYLNVAGKKNGAYAFVYQQELKQKNKIEYGKVFVTLDHCRKGYGYVVYNDMSGEFDSRASFVRFGPTIGDFMGSAACDGWDSETGKVSRVNDEKSWQLVSKSDDAEEEYSIKSDTVRRQIFNKKPSIVGLLSQISTKADTAKYWEALMGVSDCKNGYGSLYLMNVEGVLESKFDVALNGKSIASHIAGALCRKI